MLQVCEGSAGAARNVAAATTSRPSVLAHMGADRSHAVRGAGAHHQSARHSCTARAASRTAAHTPPRPRPTGTRARTSRGRPPRGAPGSAPAPGLKSSQCSCVHRVVSRPKCPATCSANEALICTAESTVHAHPIAACASATLQALVLVGFLDRPIGGLASGGTLKKDPCPPQTLLGSRGGACAP